VKVRYEIQNGWEEIGMESCFSLLVFNVSFRHHHGHIGDEGWNLVNHLALHYESLMSAEKLSQK
jgi:hypothetical protein